MATNDCPNCGKPLRPGARFCGNCGYVVAAAATPSPVQQPGSSAGEVSVPCPKCGKPVRESAKFCNNCGQSIVVQPPAAVEPPRPPAPAQVHPSAAAREQRTMPSSNVPTAVVKPAHPAAGAAPHAAAPVKRAPRVGLRLAITAVFLLLCVFSAAGGYYVAVNYLPDWLGGKATATHPATPTLPKKPQPVVTKTSPPVQSLPTMASSTPEISPSSTVVPATITSSPTTQATLRPTDTVMPTVITSPVTSGFILFEDSFDRDLQDNWSVWGQPRPRTGSVANTFFLDLTAGDSPAEAGVTSLATIPFQFGVEITFEAQLNDKFPYSLIFDWDPAPFDRSKSQPGKNGGGDDDDNSAVATSPSFFPFPSRSNFKSGLQAPLPAEVVGFRITIRRDRLVLTIPEGKICQIFQENQKPHIYRVRVADLDKLEFTIDGRRPSDCPAVVSGVNLNDGTISFTGHGWIFNVEVTVP